MPSPQNPIRTWLQLLRAPNLLTVPGDPVAGYFLACFGAADTPLWPVILASLAFYAGGLLLNDLADLDEDGRERPARPLPAGLASPRIVLVVAIFFFAAALSICWGIGRSTFATGGVLLLAITIYNTRSKRVPIVGALNMGACRALSLLLGATAVSHGDLTYPLIAHGRLDHLVAAALVLTAYIAAITHLARFETRHDVPALAKILPALALSAGVCVFLPELHLYKGLQLLFHEQQPNASVVSLIVFIIAAINAWQVAATLLRDRGAPLPPQIGTLIRLLLLFQAALCAASSTIEGMSAAVVLVLFWPVARLLGRWFYAS